MEKIDALNQVAEFHQTFNHPIMENPAIPAEDRCKLRVALIAEELKELEAAIKDKDMVEVADALCDLQYVLAGAILEFGLGKSFIDLFNEVHRSNMSKACQTKEEAEETIKFFKEQQNVDSYFTERENFYLVYRKSDNKTLKSINYSPANLKL
ncbi:hypothetical protein BH23BAC1_BH23BAC1_49370 [soil metagenome]